MAGQLGAEYFVSPVSEYVGDHLRMATLTSHLRGALQRPIDQPAIGRGTVAGPVDAVGDLLQNVVSANPTTASLYAASMVNNASASADAGERTV